ncbi:bifunctional precorrin-2 dehydrogenase/sirohydrochlorin ferrochelatase [Geobacter sp. SVR]|uniref:precorrin-2 dehydrogenase/sirohydrochlorin ferrochelatase family protein n=1 Tax=Geobacter sp. SVR TaxID=2495594 RepID=UPI00143EF530|nr:bifunctional precorrin-2 dehydrogenase/sirohydrochlorin ferrochelatase [Geobacter sp. SVR]BCS51994.1 siroheme synthase [Geobacter sp. SVR]GCF87191.1 siroheme synthase [Geobacter sp. SVR]
MSGLPLNIDMKGRPVLVAGGGSVAYRKVKVLLESQAMVRIVAPEMLPDLAGLTAAEGVPVRLGRYETGDLEGVFLVVAATGDAAVNARIAADARERGILVAVSDAPDLGDCTFPAVVRRGALEIAVSTGGRCPALAVEVRNVLAGVIGEEYGLALEHLAAEREKLLTEGKGSTYNGAIMRSRARELVAEFTERKERVP